jgi:hypothetical protein
MPDRLTETLDGLRGVRDEMRLQLHLANAEARKHFEKLEKRWSRLEGQMKAFREATEEDRAQIRKAVQHLARELREGYRQLRRQL